MAPSIDEGDARPLGKAPRGGALRYGARLRYRVLAAMGCLVGAIGVAVVSLGTVWGQSLDTVAMEALIRWSPSLDAIGAFVTGVIGVPLMVAVTLVVAALAVLRRRPTLAGRALGMVIAANVSSQILKMVIDRPDLGVTTALANSLPSGHVTAAMSLCLAMVMVAPEWLRGPAAWFAWVWTSLVGISVMVSAWHRLADVVVSVLVTGAWALLLSPLEVRVRHGVIQQKVMSVVVGLSLLGAFLASIIALAGAGLIESANPGSSGYGFSDFVRDHPLRAQVLAGAAILWTVAVVGAVANAVDRLSGE